MARGKCCEINVNADKMAAVAKLTGKEEDGAGTDSMFNAHLQFVSHFTNYYVHLIFLPDSQDAIISTAFSYTNGQYIFYHRRHLCFLFYNLAP